MTIDQPSQERLSELRAIAEEEIGPPTPLGALKFRMEQGGHTQADLAKLIGSRARASEILSGKRELSKAQIAVVSDTWGIPTRSLLGPDATNWKYRAQSAEAEVERLTKEREEANEGWTDANIAWGKALSRATSAEARIIELEEQVEKIAKPTPTIMMKGDEITIMYADPNEADFAFEALEALIWPYAPALSSTQESGGGDYSVSQGRGDARLDPVKGQPIAEPRATGGEP